MGFLLAPVARLENGIADIFSSFFLTLDLYSVCLL